MENENQTIEQTEVTEANQSQFHTVTPLSKYLAMGLFIVLPFLGGWIGYTYAPEKVVEVEKVVIKEVPSDSSEWALPNNLVSMDTQTDSEESMISNSSFTISSSSIQPDWKTYRSEKHDFELSFPNEYDSFSTIISFSSTESDTSIFVLPKGGADYGLEGVDFSSEEIKMGDNFETKDIAIEDGFYREFVYFSSSSIPVSWNNLNRIEVRIDEPSKLTDEILSTFNFVE